MLATLPDPTRTTLPSRTTTLDAPPATRVPPSTPATTDDGRLVGRVAAGDDRAFAELVRRHHGLVRAVAAGMLDGSCDVDDVVQDTFVAAWLHLADVVEGDAIAGWLVTTARRRSVDRLRAAAHRRRGEAPEESVAPVDHRPEAVVERASLVAAARRALAAMPPLQRRCWELRHVDGLCYRDVAEVVGLPASTVRGLIARARLDAERSSWR
ncbi:RNA polymerase sigma factor [Curtobacterium sp. MCBA15_012]|uniref:RNA polymerase sigma factor n=1 Tax=Curtobacterium sp. MCBA15_012 TaxID=1898738 RepID=UPI0009F60A00|nr:sigma-70 family RNA polymerase sigma factor [Curtobacterium sp. MCBA15_012]WIB00456.1 sigma-70 family RNA polymerase sigma factor [Curtobacterium sp. MCBA15_012]